MRWSERQLAMLREMGIRVWAPEAAAAVDGEGAVTMVAERTPATAWSAGRRAGRSDRRSLREAASRWFTSAAATPSSRPGWPRS